jgi:hypothetical protein
MIQTLAAPRCTHPQAHATGTGLSLLATNRTFHFGLKHAVPSLAELISLYKSSRHLNGKLIEII